MTLPPTAGVQSNTNTFAGTATDGAELELSGSTNRLTIAAQDGAKLNASELDENP